MPLVTAKNEDTTYLTVVVTFVFGFGRISSDN